jgi:hypothetical protein
VELFEEPQAVNPATIVTAIITARTLFFINIASYLFLDTLLHTIKQGSTALTRTLYMIEIAINIQVTSDTILNKMKR